MTVPTTWHDLTSARTQWADAPDDDESLQTLLDVAQNDVMSFAPKTTDDAGNPVLAWKDPISRLLVAVDDTTIPVSYRLAHLMQARNTWNAAKVDPANAGMGDGSFVIKPFPLDWAIKQLIRPKDVLPWVG